MIKMPISEIADRYSICMLKNERTEENLIEEISIYGNELNTYENIDNFVEQLYEINGKIWDLESSIRKGNEISMSYHEIGQRTLQIRDLNRQRIKIKNEMVERYQEGFKDIKINHASEEKLNS